MTEINAEIITIGDEILYGHIVDTNSQWMSAALSDAGIKVVRNTTVGDVIDDILAAFANAGQRADVVLITGGLGPTRDDLTKPCLARYFACEMRLHEEALAEVTAFFASRGRALTELNRQQAVLPVACEKITNAIGTAPGMWFDRDGKVFVSMPGVPREMKRMMTDFIVPRLVAQFKPTAIHHRIIKTVGIGESFLADKIAPWEDALPKEVRLAYLPGYGEVKLRLTTTGAMQNMQGLIEALKPLAGPYIYGYDDDTLATVLGRLLRERRQTIACAESCTGGYVSSVITEIPGSSAYFRGSIVAYANDIKQISLGVHEEVLRAHGAVSEAVVCAMAEGARRQLGADLALATTGIAGPDGGTDEKPVGTVWIGCADERHTVARKLQLSNDRALNVRLTATHALNLARRVLLGLTD